MTKLKEWHLIGIIVAVGIGIWLWSKWKVNGYISVGPIGSFKFSPSAGPVLNQPTPILETSPNAQIGTVGYPGQVH